MLFLPELLKDWPCTVFGGEFRINVNGVSECSSRVQEGFIFVARKGGRMDGLEHIKEAIENGAVAIVVDRATLQVDSINVPIIQVPNCQKFLAYASAQFANNPSKRLTMIAVTGTNGKTTVTHLIGQLLQKLGIQAAVIGTTGCWIDGVKVEADIPEMTSLPAEFLHPLLATCEQRGVSHIILEASSIGLASGRLDACDLDIGILLNIGLDHYEEHGGKQAYIEAKKQLISMVNTMIVNEEDPLCMQMIEGATVPITYFGEHKIADKIAPNLNIPFPGYYNRLNLFAAMSALILLGYRIEELIPHIASLRLPEGRLQRLERDGVTVYIDYAHTPDALQAVLQTLCGVCYGKLITVFGCGGERDKGKRKEMGELAVYYSSNVFVTSDNPRNEDPSAIIADILVGFGGDCSAIEVVPNRKNAIRQAIFSAAPGDIVLIAGKGHEKTQHTAEGIFPFSDFDEAKQALTEKTYIDIKDLNKG
ncbi:UDP-N-acetylmuramoyl-L-alanyl-D-glutamate--2,6-diaminopimelate ligase [Sporosarcina sp. HYO08]|uniref:UDP-N-acetylmuramoyl-L-alanyl-D-glutamate--2, 6-diaminopimelate ligase n=1 Tax=Sporosarcina sp. HYO08 TaxID=1759557 RepID=UPI00079BB599|nr:UDP-N-acetylmuramoyl-L-alanyl-D-glutamate--2,6-diaminopimelate ligase [Sporosarcina sp. HYO08]KXH79876.1 hypothetical protein AU377_10375 [Sporosarcina sp. HYO08]